MLRNTAAPNQQGAPDRRHFVRKECATYGSRSVGIGGKEGESLGKTLRTSVTEMLQANEKVQIDEN